MGPIGGPEISVSDTSRRVTPQKRENSAVIYFSGVNGFLSDLGVSAVIVQRLRVA